MVNIALNTFDTQLYLNQRCALLRNFTKINNYYFLCIFNGFLLNYINKYIGNGSNQENLSLTDILDLQLPIPKSTQKITEWVDKISKPYDEKNKIQELIMKLEEDIKTKIKDIEKNEECDEVVLSSICDIMCGKNLTKDKSISGNYNVYGGGETSYTHNEYNLEGFNILISRVGNNNIKLVNEKFYLTDNGFSLLITDIKIKKYIGYYLLNNEDKILNAGNGSAQKVISKTKLSTIKLKLPKNKTLMKDFEPLFNEIEKLQIELKEAEIEYIQLINKLSEEAIPTNKIKDSTEKIISKNTDVEEINEEVEENKNNDDKPINLEKQSKKELEKICKDKFIIFKSKDTKKILIEKIINHKED